MKRWVSVRQADLEFGEITGILEFEAENRAIVEYTYKRTNITPFGTVRGVEEQEMKGSAHLL